MRRKKYVCVELKFFKNVLIIIWVIEMEFYSDGDRNDEKKMVKRKREREKKT
jgi:hypothetical protein